LAPLALVRGMILRTDQSLARAKYQDKQHARAWKSKSPEQILA